MEMKNSSTVRLARGFCIIRSHTRAGHTPAASPTAEPPDGSTSDKPVVMRKRAHKASGDCLQSRNRRRHIWIAHTSRILTAQRGGIPAPRPTRSVAAARWLALESLGKYIGRRTNNAAEYYALIAALDYAMANGIKAIARAKRLAVDRQSDEGHVQSEASGTCARCTSAPGNRRQLWNRLRFSMCRASRIKQPTLLRMRHSTTPVAPGRRSRPTLREL